jgi:hypothetical protein
MRRLLRAAACVLACVVGACERIDTPPPTTKSIAVGQGITQASPLGSDPRLNIAHTGVRRLEFASETGPALFFLERIASDGQGKYALEPLGPAGSSVPDWNAFELMQHLREGFLFRYRDFNVRDPQLLQQNWSLTNQGETEVAGRACRAYRLERRYGEPVAYEVSVDEATGLVLASRELDAQGLPIASMVYESIELAPTLDDVVWHVPSNQEERVDSPEELQAETSTRLLEPRLLPEGYASFEAARVGDGDGRTWLKRTYSDGIEPLFFMQELEPRPRGKNARGENLAPAVPSAAIVFRMGAVTVIQGEIEGFHLIAIGKVSEAELLDLVESALP